MNDFYNSKHLDIVSRYEREINVAIGPAKTHKDSVQEYRIEATANTESEILKRQNNTSKDIQAVVESSPKEITPESRLGFLRQLGYSFLSFFDKSA
ncbi:MAG: hypothetical protein P1V18_01540 [Candidatus Gracilibacteria bacterium]|nr:hypothetical protein [Candidatus Gracilibacteria bacterium]